MNLCLGYSYTALKIRNSVEDIQVTSAGSLAKELKYLGIRLDDKLNWNSHLTHNSESLSHHQDEASFGMHVGTGSSDDTLAIHDSVWFTCVMAQKPAKQGCKKQIIGVQNKIE